MLWYFTPVHKSMPKPLVSSKVNQKMDWKHGYLARSCYILVTILSIHLLVDFGTHKGFGHWFIDRGKISEPTRIFFFFEIPNLLLCLLFSICHAQPDIGLIHFDIFLQKLENLLKKLWIRMTTQEDSLSVDNAVRFKSVLRIFAL